MLHPALAALLDFRGQVVVITGASRGLGRNMAEWFNLAGARVALLARSQTDLNEVAAAMFNRGADPGTVLTAKVDVGDDDDVNTAAARILDQWKRVDVLINNAGLIHAGSYTTIDLMEWERLLNANLTGAYRCVRAFAPSMQMRKYGRIINISSISAQTGGVSGGVHYAASKGGMLAMTKTLARDLAPDGITVNAIAPGQIESRPDLLSAEARESLEQAIPLGKLGHPSDIAFAALFLASPMAAYITGTTLDVNGGLLKR
jgi:NAD(P)-dependent dehydrogenase (short-subunit alcohol dehydrogenase family)